MKLDHCAVLVSAAVLAFACGCGSTASGPAPRLSANAASASAAVPANVGTTNLMSAEIPGPAPKVGKAHLDHGMLDDDSMEVGSTGNVQSEESPKEARRSDGSRRGGGFGTTTK